MAQLKVPNSRPPTPYHCPPEAPTPQHDTLGTEHRFGILDGCSRCNRGVFATTNAMASARIKLDPPTVEAIARRVVEILERRGLQSRELVDAAELARRFGIDRSWVYSHAIELGAVKLGSGQNHGFASIHRSRRAYCGRRVRKRRPIRPPARVSGRIGLQPAEGARCGCFRLVARGRTNPRLRLR